VGLKKLPLPGGCYDLPEEVAIFYDGKIKTIMRFFLRA
jgi:hypothetical protein